MKKLTLILVILIAATSYSQVEKSYFSIYGTFTLPMSDFKEDNEFNEDGFALAGLGEPEFDYEGNYGDPPVEFKDERKFKMYVFQFLIGYDF